jgi:outer membrane lipoprotein carrier protein
MSLFVASYLAFLVQTGTMPAAPAAPKAKLVAAPVAAIVIETETRAPAPTPGTASQSIGVDLAVTDLAGVQVATAATANEVVDAVQKFYSDIKQVTAKFRQEFTNATFGKKTTNDGKVWIKKPGMMRWDYYSTKKTGKKKKTTVTKSFISNGSYLYVVEHENKAVLEKNLDNNLLPVAVTFLYGKGDLKTDFDAALDTKSGYGAKGDLVLKLTPKVTSTAYKTLYLVVDSSDYRVKQSVIIDSAGNINSFRFYEPDFEKAVADKWFKFSKKSVPNYRITTDDADTKDKDKAKKDTKSE